MPENLKEEQLDEIYGIVESVTFRKEENGFTVLELDIKEEIVTVVGIMPEVFSGEELKLRGKWQSHPSFGPQFRAELASDTYLQVQMLSTVISPLVQSKV